MDRIFVRLIASCDKSRNLMLKQSFYASVLYGTLMVSLNINCRSSAAYWKRLRYKLICYEMISYLDYKLFSYHQIHREFKITNSIKQMYKRFHYLILCFMVDIFLCWRCFWLLYHAWLIKVPHISIYQYDKKQFIAINRSFSLGPLAVISIHCTPHL